MNVCINESGKGSAEWPKGATHRLVNMSGEVRFGHPVNGVLRDVESRDVLDAATWNEVAIDFSRHLMVLCEVETDGTLRKVTPSEAYQEVMDRVWAGLPRGTAYSRERNSALRAYARDRIFTPYDAGYFLGFYGVPIGHGADECDILAVRMGECSGVYVPEMMEPVSTMELT